MSEFRTFSAAIRLLPPSEGGLTSPLPAKTTSLVIRTSSRNPGFFDLDQTVVLTAQRPWVGGQSQEALVMPLHDEAWPYLSPGSSFLVWYGRVVGDGFFLTD